MEPATVATVLDTVAELYPVSPDVEVTLEANPTSVEAGKFREFREAGANRVSLGVQALNDADLRRLGRMHSAAEARAAFDIARSSFDRVSFDLIYARQHQTPAHWEKELNQAIDLAVDHLSLYQLTIEAGTRFGELAQRNRLTGLPSVDMSADMYELTQDICNARGLVAYEVSNHARAGAESRHNLTYWRYGPYLGIGPGAHGRPRRNGRIFASEATRDSETWLAGGLDSTRFVELGRLDVGQEMLLMGLRLNEGLSMERFSETTGYKLNPEVMGELNTLDLITYDDDRVRTTRAGRLVLNAVIEKLSEDWVAL